MFAKAFTRMAIAKKKAITKECRKAVREAVSDVLIQFYYADFNHVGEIQKMTAEQYADKCHELFKKVEEQYGIEEV